ncbi:site-specific DNA-methyltransferase [Chryseobacterium sp. Hurlbut01]|uniref:site-specific DNA-methyltransferase n=1 Tax=Chryseobacterium sp. Hurlbut01 TaxID=1681828 RepID=UPI00067A9198|nr:site-specific DNA-methyltransferase [Chryseobacterium sp. Hurlbut01]KNB62265.1 hypothetical protein AC804_05220 [Chryseobacterium sp. Hurlbut01]
MNKVKNSILEKLSQKTEVESEEVGVFEIPEEYRQLFTDKNTQETTDQLTQQIIENGFYKPITCFRFDNKLIIIDGVLRFGILKSLGVNQINFIDVGWVPESSNDIKDLIIKIKMHSSFSLREIERMINHYIRLDENLISLNKSTLNKRISELVEVLPPGFGRSNIFKYIEVFRWEKKNPDSHLKVIDNIFEGNISIGKAKDIISIFKDPALPYTLKDDKSSGIVHKYINGEIRTVNDVKKLIVSFIDKTENRFTKITTPKIISSKNYEILNSDSRDVKFTVGTEIQAIFTSPPYYRQHRYTKPGEPEYKNEIGWEDTPEDYINNLMSVVNKGTAIMDDKGVIIININETFIKGECVGIVPLLITEMKKQYHYIQTCMWIKPDAKPQANKVRRLSNTFEYILIFSKTKKYYYNQFRLYNAAKSPSVSKGCSETFKGGKKVSGIHIKNSYDQCKDFMSEGDFMDYFILNQTSGRSQDENLLKDFHCSFPTMLPVPFIMSFVPENGTVWDPFGGTGTTGRTLLSLNRKVIITELLASNIPNIKQILETGKFRFQ